jgi:hypothetical protein
MKTRSNMDEVKAAMQLQMKIALFIVERFEYFPIRYVLGQVPTTIDPDPTRPVFPQLASRITKIIADAEASPEKIISQNTEHLPTVFFSYESTIVIILIRI